MPLNNAQKAHLTRKLGSFRGSPLLWKFFEIRLASGLSNSDLERQSGFTYNATRRWLNRTGSPCLLTFDAMLRAMGFKLVIVPIKPGECL